MAIPRSVVEAMGSPAPLEHLAPGVLGYTVWTPDALYIPVIQAVSEGNGDVGRFLDSLIGTVRIPDVLSTRLLGMLERRGYLPTRERAEEFGEYVDVMERAG